MRVAARVVRELAKRLVTVLLIKAGGLEAERADMRVARAAGVRVVFGSPQHASAVSCAARGGLEPEHLDVQPPCPDPASQPAAQLTTLVAQAKRDRPELAL